MTTESGHRAASADRREPHPWITFVLPMVVFLLAGNVEPKPPNPQAVPGWLSVPYAYYPIVYLVRIVLTLAAMALALPGYRRVPLRVTLLAIVVGLVGGGLWIGLTMPRWEEPLLALLNLEHVGARSAYNPFQELTLAPALGFLFLRLFGLVLVVPVVEEFFVRGFLMRFFVASDWSQVPWGKLNTAAVVVGVLLYPILSHPAEMFAAVAWFALITWLYVKTRSLWDCVVAHALSNLVLAMYVLVSGQWRLI